MKVRKGDVVEIIAGADVGKRGKILQILTGRNGVIVEGVNFVYKHRRPTRDDPQGGRIQREASVDASNVLVVCNKCNRGMRTSQKAVEGKKRIRVCAKCGEAVGA